MGRTLTDRLGLSVATELTELNPDYLGFVFDPENANPATQLVKFRELEPDTIGSFSPTLVTVVRNPISINRQNRKGTVTDLDSTASFDSDLTVSSFTDFIEGVMFSKFTGVYSSQTSYQTSTDPALVSGSIGRYSAVEGITAPSTIDVAGTAGIGDPANRFVKAGSLIYNRSFVNPVNNGIFVVASVTLDSIVVTAVNLATVALTTNDLAQVETAGFRFSAADLVIAGAGPQYTITSTADITNWGTELGIVPGQALWLGGEIGGGNTFPASTNRGWVRVVSVNGASITVDKALNSLTPETSVTAVDVYFGRFVRNVSVDENTVGVSEGLERSYQIRGRYDNLSNVNPGAPEFENSRGNFLNEMVFNLPLTAKSTINYSFIGIDTAFCDIQPTLQDGEELLPNRTVAFNSSSDLARLRINNIDESGLTTDFKSITLTINNNVTPEKVLGVLGAKYINNGQFDVTIATQAVFTDRAVSDAVRNYNTLTMDFAIANGDGAIYCDVPTLSLGGGAKSFPRNESILIDFTGNAFADASVFNTTISFSVFPFVPSDAVASTITC